MANTTPFLYLIGWSDLQVWYVGVRWRKGCQPLDLWTTYFTSSKFVAAMRADYGEPDTFDILQVGSKEEVLVSEEALIADFALHRDPMWLNRCAGGRHFYYRGCSDETRRKISEANKGRVYSEKRKQDLSTSTKAAWSKPNSALRSRVAPARNTPPRMVTGWGVEKPLTEWLAEYPGVSLHQFHVRLGQGWTVERALTQKVRTRRSLK